MATILTATLPPVLSAGAFSLDTIKRELVGPAGSVRLNRGPYLVLRDLMRRPGMVRSLQQLIETLWPDTDMEPGDPEKSARMTVRRARDALEQVGVPRDRLALRFQQGYAIERQPGVVRVFTAEQAALVDRILSQQQTAEITP